MAKWWVALEVRSELDFLFAKDDNNGQWLSGETIFKQVYVKEGMIVEVDANLPLTLIASRSKVWNYSRVLSRVFDI